jgi:multicomponent Na+:H+ antiporter subunit G
MIGILTVFLILTGSGLMLIAAIGVLRLPDVLCRAHAVAKALTLGVFLILSGLWLHLYGQQASLKILLAIFFQVVTIPVASHLLGLLAYKKNLPRWQPRPVPRHPVSSD